MKAYLELLEDVLNNGKFKGSRPGIETRYKFATELRINLQEGFPLLTTKKINLARVIGEMFAFFRGETNINGFHELDCHLWDSWALDRDFYHLRKRTEAELIQQLIDNGMVDPTTAVEQHKEAIATYLTKREAVIAEGDEEALADFMLNNPEPVSLDVWFTNFGAEVYEKEYFNHEGDLGPIYGKQWVRWETPDGKIINQLEQVMDLLKNNPTSRRIILSAWNPADISDEKADRTKDNRLIERSQHRAWANVMEGKMALPPCHLMTLFDVDISTTPPTLNVHQIMRSNDLPVGCPFNIAGYAYLAYQLAKQLDYQVGELVINTTNSHIYQDQVEGVIEQLKRDPRPLPTLTIPDGIDILDKSTLTLENIQRICDNLVGYDPHPFIKFNVAT